MHEEQRELVVKELHALFTKVQNKSKLVSASELSILSPYVAGEAAIELQDILKYMSRKSLALSKADFTSLLIQRLYQSPTEKEGVKANVAFSYAIISLLRRDYIGKFKSYFEKKGLTGAEHLPSLQSQKNNHPHRRRNAKKHNLRVAAKTNYTAAERIAIVSEFQKKSVNHAVNVYKFKNDSLECIAENKVVRDVATSANSIFLVLKDTNDKTASSSSSCIRINTAEKSSNTPLALHLSKEGQQVIEELSSNAITSIASYKNESITVISSNHSIYTWGTQEILATPVFDGGDLIEAAKVQMKQLEIPQDFYLSFNRVMTEKENFVRKITDGNSYCESELLKLWNETLLLKMGPMRIRTKKRFSVVSVGKDFTIGLDTFGKVYSWGSDSMGALGLGDTEEDFVSSPTLVEGCFSDITSVSIAVGRSHVLVLSENGNVYSWGNNIYGQVGSGLYSPHNSPVKVVCNTSCPWVQVAAGDYHSLLLNSDGRVYSAGRNWQGQLGLGDTSMARTPLVTEIGKFKANNRNAVLRIAANGDSSAAVVTKEEDCCESKVYVWGKAIVNPEFGLIDYAEPVELRIPLPASSSANINNIAICNGTITITAGAED